MDTLSLRVVTTFIIYMLDGVMILGGMELLISRFFGYRVKPRKSRRPIFIGVLVGYVLINFIVYSFVAPEGNKLYELSELLYLFTGIYWLNNLEERKRWRKVVCVFTSALMLQLTEGVLNHSMILVMHGNTVLIKALIVLAVTKLTVIALITGVSFLSSRKRKEPMRLSLMVIAFIVFIFIQLVDSAFFQTEEGVIKQVVSVELLLSEELIEAILGYAFIIILVLFTGIMIFLIIKESEAQYFQKKNTISEYYLEAQKQHYETLSESNKEIRKIKHDMKNHIYCLQGLYESGNYEELGRYLNEMDEGFKHVAVTNFVGHEIADAIISEKTYKARERGISLTAEGALFGVELAAIDVCTIFSNILDNAIEAVEKLPEDKRRIVLRVGHNKNYLLISEYNPVEKAPDIRDNGIATTKTNSANHGFGITNIREAAAKYDGDIQLFTDDDTESGEKYFHIEVMFPIQD